HLAGRPEDDQDHEARRARASSNRPRHIPRPCPTAYSGVATASVASSRGVRPARTPNAAAATPQPASATGASSGRRAAATATAALAGKNATTNGKKRDSGVPCPSTKTTPRCSAWRTKLLTVVRGE